MQILDSLAPVFLLIALGSILVRSGFLQKEFLRGLNDLAYWVGLPAVIFLEIARADLETGGFWSVLGVFGGGTAVAIGGSWIAIRALRLPRVSQGTFIQAGFRGNLAFIGLPVVLFAFGDAAGAHREQTLAAAVLVLAPILIAYNVVSVFVLCASHSGDAGDLMKRTVRQVATNPLILASIGGLMAALLGISFPTFLNRSLEALSRLALPLALICIGGSLVIVPVKSRLSTATTASLVKVALAPAAGLAIGLVFGVNRPLMLVAMIYLACPTAAASYVLARQLGGDEALAASSVVISTVLSLVSLAAVVGMI